MIIVNNTSISIDLIKAIMVDAGIDLTVDYTLTFNVLEKSEGMKSGNVGQCYSYEFEGVNKIFIDLRLEASTEILAHEIRHAYQTINLGIETLNDLYQMEQDLEGYDNNVFELDAVEFGKRWKV